MLWKLLWAFLILSSYCFSQPILSGAVKNKKGKAVFAANVYLQKSPQKGTTTDFEGDFKLKIVDLSDTLMVSFIGFQTKEIPLTAINFNEPLIIILTENRQSLAEVIITAQDPISEQFSVVSIKKMDIYFNPVSQGDPLKAITTLPASTTTDETANPSLRGSSANRSRVVLNGVPIYNPVRASQLNNQGFFSLFNPEIIDKMYVYASNPPLTHGNTSAGLVEIQTNKELTANQLQVSASLASAGVFLSQQLKKEVSFVQVYGNYQFSGAFVGIQKKQLPTITNFITKDAGVNFNTKLGKRINFNSYNYFINEAFNGLNEQFTYKGEVVTNTKRFFTVNNLNYYTAKGVLSLNSGASASNQRFSFGNIRSKNQTHQLFTSLNYKWLLSENTDVQLGVSHDYQRNNFNDSIPVYYYALSPNSPNYFTETGIANSILEAYLYTHWEVNNKLAFSSGVRSNVPVNGQKKYLSAQLGLKYKINNKQSFLLSGGKYHNYSTPNFFAKNFSLLSSYQIALDYTLGLKNTLVQAAVYAKNETGEQAANSFFMANKVNTFGVELFLAHTFYNFFQLTFSNSYINQVITIDNENYKGQNDFNYLIKTTLQYNNPTLFSLALTYIGRPGTYYNPIAGATFDSKTGFYKPFFGDDLYSRQFNNYNRLDLSLSKYIRFKKNALIAFTSVNNVLNQKNESKVLHNSDYLSHRFDYFQLRVLYFGVVWQLNY